MSLGTTHESVPAAGRAGGPDDDQPLGEVELARAGEVLGRRLRRLRHPGGGPAAAAHVVAGRR